MMMNSMDQFRGFNVNPVFAGSTTGEDGVVVTEDGGVKMVDRVICGFRVAKQFRENTDAINSISFSKEGDIMVTSADDDQIITYNCESGTVKRSLKSKKYGVNLIHWTNAANTVIHASTKIDDTIRYLSVHDNKYLRYFQGHTNRVTTLTMSDVNDQFISTSLDRTLRLWDLRSPSCAGFMHMKGIPVAAFDPEGIVFATGINSESINLYDLRTFDKGPFSTFLLPFGDNCEWSSFKFSPNGLQILLTINGSPLIRVVDAFQGTPIHTLTGHVNNDITVSLEASYSPDSQYIFSGSQDGKVYVWNAETGSRLCVLNGDHPRCVQCVKFNPKYMMMASACTDMNFWLPNPSLFD